MRHFSQLLLGASLLFLFAVSANAQTVTVTISEDTVDIDWTTATIADLPGPDGEVSLSEALIATNNTPGHQTIAFAIPQSNWQLPPSAGIPDVRVRVIAVDQRFQSSSDGADRSFSINVSFQPSIKPRMTFGAALNQR